MADSICDQSAAPAPGSGEPLYFPHDAPRLFGWLHRPTGSRSPGTGVVICQPFGYEALCGHRAVRAFAEAAAAAGVPALRFDYLGTGDSANIAGDADQIAQWLEDVRAAVDELRRQTGVTRVCLLGFRLGALLATCAATHSRIVDGLVLVAPVTSGLRYVRELRMVRMAAKLRESSNSLADGSGDVTTAGVGSLEVSGYTLSGASLAALSKVDLDALGPPPVARILLVDRDDLPSSAEWRRSLTASAVAVDYQVMPGFVGMMLTAPQFTVLPHAMIDVVATWLAGFAERTAAPAPGRDSTAVSAVSSLELGDDGSGFATAERPVRFGPDGLLFGVVTEPPRNERRRRAVVLVNSGADHHIGAGRLYVSLARHWARRGYLVLRMDLAGLGDSGTRPGGAANVVFPSTAIKDLAAALEFVRARYGAREVILGGLCSAAYHALRAAVEGVSVDRILMVNPLNFFWDEDSSLTDLQLADVVRNPGLYLQERIWSAAAWKRLVGGEVNVGRILAVYLRRAYLAVESALRGLARRLRLRLDKDLQRELETVAARGVKMVFVFARGDPGLELLRLQGGLAIERLGDRCRVHVIDNADHEFTRSSARARLEHVLSEELFSP